MFYCAKCHIKAVLWALSTMTVFDDIIDKMGVGALETYNKHTVFKRNVVCSFVHMEPWDNKSNK